MKRFCLLIVALFGVWNLHAQIKELSHAEGGPDLPTLHIHVWDAGSREPMPGATVTVIPSPGDTLHAATNRNGYLRLNPVLKEDSITLRTSYVGYKTQERRLPARYTARYEVNMQIDSLQISAIVIQGKQIAMIQRGDTTLYNASAFKTMRGDRMGELLKQLPGVEIRGEKLYAGGEEVTMILINGSMLFGRNTQAAMDLIRSDNVERVRVYDQHAADRLIEQDTLKPKERVMDVQTKQQVRQVSEVQLSAAAGAYVAGDGESGNPLGTLGAFYRRFAAEKMGIFFYGTADYNTRNTNPTTQPTRGLNFSLALNHDKARKHTFTQTVMLNTERNKRNSLSENRYMAHGEMPAYTATMDNQDQEGNLDLGYNVRYNRKVGQRNTFSISASAHYKTNHTDWHHLTLNTLPEARYGTDVRNRDEARGYGVNLSSSYRQMFKKPNRTLSLSLSYLLDNQRGDGLTIDTTAMSTSPQWRTSRLRASTNELHARIDYTEPLAKRWCYKTAYHFSLNNNHSDLLSWDELLQQRDTVGTHHYTYRYLSYWWSNSIEYTNKDRSLSSTLGLTHYFTRIGSEEHFPVGYDQRTRYRHWTPSLIVSYRKKSLRLTARYSESPTVPAIEQLRPYIDDSSPLFLTAGNPTLEQPLSRTARFTINLNRAKQAASLELNGSYRFTSNQIVNQVRYFAEETYLPEYDYTTMAGASLSEPVNVNGARNFSTRLALAKKSNALKATFRLSADHLYQRNPFYQNTTLSINDAHTANLTLQYISNFSQHVELTLRNTLGKGWHNRDGKELYESINELVGGTLRVNFLKRFWVQGDGNYSYSNTTREGMRIEQTILNLSVSCKFGKDDMGEVSLHANDLLDRTKSLTVTTTDDYIRVMRSDLFGRSFYCKFMVRF